MNFVRLAKMADPTTVNQKMRSLYNRFKEENRQQKAEREREIQEAKNLET